MNLSLAKLNSAKISSLKVYKDTSASRHPLKMRDLPAGCETVGNYGMYSLMMLGGLFFDKLRCHNIL